MGDHQILIGIRHFLTFQKDKVRVNDWNFHLPKGCRFIAGGKNCKAIRHTISLFIQNEKIGQFVLEKRDGQYLIVVEAISSDYTIEIMGLCQTIVIQEKC
ncbi:hypothetical protein [Brevibacillus daliensis]|uniref:hypothetical protein n=1 Tax=Brevibacillus daliensis TaxID=2892995 RepID=UPI001E36AE9D|nr:hypothetical protein [Brevibacillus daliensis]